MSFVPDEIVLAIFLLVQCGYSISLLIVGYLRTLPVDWVDVRKADALTPEQMPYIVLFYPVLRELETTMATTMLSLSRLDYPADRFRVVAIPNANDTETVASLRRIAKTFPFLQIVEVPPTTDKSWGVVWQSWDRTDKAYWWHRGPRAGNQDLPPKKTRQLIYAFYHVAREFDGREDFLVNYIDADSCPPRDHFRAAAAGMQRFDVLQAQNIAGNLNATMAASWHSFDHMAWDGYLWPHLSAGGRQPYWVLGKGLFFKASDLVALGGFHPWITIEDPEVGMRFWTNGKRLGVIENPLIEEVPSTIGHGITQRKRWVCGFFQSLSTPLSDMGMTRSQRLRARLNFLPCLLLSVNSIGVPVGLAAVGSQMAGQPLVPDWAAWVGWVNLMAFTVLLSSVYAATWRRARLVAPSRRERLYYFLRVNPVSLILWWLIWTIPLWIGFWMFRRDGGLIWERTVKIDANHALVRRQQPATVRLGEAFPIPSPANDSDKEIIPSVPDAARN